MKRISDFNKYAAAAILLMAPLFFSSCVKDYRSGETNFNSLQPTVSIPEGGLAQFGSQAVLFPAADAVDTSFFRINYAAVNVAPKDETITLAIDPAALASYNTGGTGLQYQMLPDSCFSFTSTSVTVASGQSYSPQVPVAIYPSKIDPTVNYMLPISIKDAGGLTISGNYGTIYLHFIGNPIAGTYEQYFSRWLASDSTGGAATANYYNADFGPAVFAPTNPTEIQVVSNAFGETDIIDFDNNGGVLSNFSVSFPDGTAAAEGVAAYGPPVFEVADPVNGYYKIVYRYTTFSGNTRLCVNTFIKQ